MGTPSYTSPKYRPYEPVALIGWRDRRAEPGGHQPVGAVQFLRVGEETTPRVREVDPATRTAWGPGTVPGVCGIQASGSAVISRTVSGMLRVAMSATETDSRIERMCSRTAIQTSTSGSAEPL